MLYQSFGYCIESGAALLARHFGAMKQCVHIRFIPLMTSRAPNAKCHYTPAMALIGAVSIVGDKLGAYVINIDH
jgi:hypothetical protein